MSGVIQTTWVWEPAIYLFLGGLAGGAFFVVTLVRFLSKNAFPRVTVIGTWTSTIALVVGLLFLVVDVSKPFQAMMMWKSFVNLNSWMAIGAWLLFAAVAFMGLCSVFSTPKIVSIVEAFCRPLARRAEAISKVCMVAGALFGLGVAMYTGVLLWSAHSIPLWNTPLIPVLFTVSALDAGASVVLVALLLEKSDGAAAFIKRVSIALVALIVLEACTLAALFFMHLEGSTSQVLSANTLLHGDLSIQFWVLVVIVGLVIPFVLTVLELAHVVRNPELSRLLHFAAAACALVGGFTLRFVILTGGMHAVLVSPDAYQAMLGVYTLIG
ncbi:NrfD/PsrC family molybdoenzyme membrane anchor subunit [uncultured Slackia sp.]|uniref:NrfD/PsrC family molybdoenzyme membrane anchor subunit n=1 Tax=uncultured Slackia sp. TaxID=665903 RepID=UPI0026E0B52D|nr:NrfD/PsrC family molybdoenzyme membrane anchor subunit [uncultured Slackia sp.]